MPYYVVIGIVAQSELKQIVRLIPLDCYGVVCNTLGPKNTCFTYSDEMVVAVLTNWQKQNPSNRREKLAKFLLKVGCMKAAIKLDANGKVIR